MTPPTTLSLQEAVAVVDGYRFLPSPPPEQDRASRRLDQRGRNGESPREDGLDANASTGPFKLFEDAPDVLVGVTLPPPQAAAKVVHAAARAFVEGRLAGRSPTFDAVQTKCFQAATSIELSDARPPWFGQPAFHARVSALLGAVPNACELGLRGLELSAGTLDASISQFSSRLRTLQLSANYFGAQGPTLFSAAWPNLQFLDLSRAGLQDEFLRQLNAKHLPALVQLHLDHNYFTSEAVEGGALPLLPSLRVLSLADCGLSFAKGALMRGVEKMRLARLSLRDNPVASDPRLAYITGLVGRVVA